MKSLARPARSLKMLRGVREGLHLSEMSVAGKSLDGPRNGLQVNLLVLNLERVV